MANDDDVSIDRYAASINPIEKVNAGASIPTMAGLWELGATVNPIQSVNQPTQQPQAAPQPQANQAASTGISGDTKGD